MDKLFLVAIILVILCAYLAWSKVEESDVEDFHPHRRFGRRGWRGFFGGWGRYFPYVGMYTGWPPNLYGGYSPKCIDSDPVSDCGIAYPKKVGIDVNGDGITDVWKCCRR